MCSEIDKTAAVGRIRSGESCEKLAFVKALLYRQTGGVGVAALNLKK
jgi:hypothetical protein